MFHSRINSRKFILIVVDYCLLFISLYIALKLRFILSEQHIYSLKQHFRPFITVFLFWVIVFYLFDLYKLKKIRSLSFVISTLMIALSIAFGLSIVFFYLVPSIITPKTILILTAFISFVLIVLWRLIWVKVIASKIKPKVAIIGIDQIKLNTLNEILEPAESHYEVIGFINLGQDQISPFIKYNVLGSYYDLFDIIKREKIEELIIAFNLYDYPHVTNKITKCLSKNIKITEMPLFYEEATGKIPIECIDQIWLLSQLKNTQSWQDIFERFVDLMLSGLGLMLALPLFPLIAFAIKIDSSGPIFYSQQRLGKNEKGIKTHKFRTMIDNAEKITGAVWSQKNDPRITRVGKFLRQTRLDELPQLYNVLKNDMSLVGPRPERPEFVKNLKQNINFYSYRHLVKPGLTGWAQIKYKYSNTEQQAMEKLQYDLYYIKNRSIILYCVILVRTIRIVLTGAGQ